MTPERKAAIKIRFAQKHLTEALAGLDEAIEASLEMRPYPQDEVDKIQEVRDIYRKRLNALELDSNNNL